MIENFQLPIQESAINNNKKTLITNWRIVLLAVEGNRNWSIYGNQTYFGYLWSPIVHWFDCGRTTFWLPSNDLNFTMLEGCWMETKKI